MIRKSKILAIGAMACLAFDAFGASEPAKKNYEITTETLPDRIAVVIESKVPANLLDATIGSSIDRVQRYLKEINATPISEPIARYFKYSEAEVHFETGFLVKMVLPNGNGIKSVVIRGGEYAVTTHVGSQESSGAAYAAIHKWLADNNYEEAGASVERYLDDPANTPEAQMRTVIQYPFKKAKTKKSAKP